MRIDALLCEAVARDASDGISAIRIGGDLFLASSVPASTKRGLIVIVSEESPGELAPGTSFEFRIVLETPSGETTVLQRSGGEVGTKRFPEFTGGISWTYEMDLRIEEWGTHRIEFSIELDAFEPLAASLFLHAIEQR